MLRTGRARVFGHLVAMLGLLLGAGQAWAGPATDQLQAAVERVLKIVQDPELQTPASADRRRSQIRQVAREIFDFDEMAKRALARHWAARTPEQRKRFTQVFADLLEASYVDKIEAYGGEKIVYLPELADGDTATVRSKLVTKRGTEVPIDYRMLRDGSRFRVYDVSIEGVSLVSNYRTQFNKIVTTSSFEELLRKMEQKQQEVVEEQRTRKPPAKTP
jgi:phospholipid transport system substrate-binding protein